MNLVEDLSKLRVNFGIVLKLFDLFILLDDVKEIKHFNAVNQAQPLLLRVTGLAKKHVELIVLDNQVWVSPWMVELRQLKVVLIVIDN
jgi:hypothetical protein